MKHLSLIGAFLAITATAAAYPSTQATDNDVPVKIGIKLHEPELNTVERWANGKQAVVAPVTPEMRRSDAGLLSADRLLSPDEYRRVAEASKTQRLDSIIGYLNNGNDKYTRQLFTYDGDFNPVMPPTLIGTHRRRRGTIPSFTNIKLTTTAMCLSNRHGAQCQANATATNMTKRSVV